MKDDHDPATEALDPAIRGFLAMRDAEGQPDIFELPPEPARVAYRQVLGMFDTPPADVETENRIINGPGGSLRLRLYRPHGRSATPRGVIVYLHGGGFIVGDPESYEGVCSRLSLSTDSLLVQVDYRLAPEHPFPAAVEDCLAALRWVHVNADDIGADPARIVVAGDSAGGNLAAVMALLARDGVAPRFSMQALIYPVLAPAPGGYPSYERFGEGLILTTAAARRVHAMYFGGLPNAPDRRGAPLLATDLDGLPPALIALAGHDVLHDEGADYAQRLARAGNVVTLLEFPSLTHGFISMGRVVQAASTAIDRIAAAIVEHLRRN